MWIYKKYYTFVAEIKVKSCEKGKILYVYWIKVEIKMSEKQKLWKFQI